jgi:16S rRNA (cytosine1402-N4)-methyltransferase
MGAPHIAVLATETMDFLTPRAGGTYVDGTLGAGGHARLILDRIGPSGRFIGVDRDANTLAQTRTELKQWPNAQLVHGRFSDLGNILVAQGVDQVDGLLLDLGVSSMQLDQGARGFSFAKAGPIDMRMDPDSDEPTALDLLCDSTPDELENILREYGEERYAKKIARRIREDARAGRLATTLDLAKAVEDEMPPKSRHTQRIHPATRTFQALRIAVNHELDELEAFLNGFDAWLRPGGRCVVISFHSLEDRLVKNRFRDLAWSSSLPPALAAAAGERVTPICRVLTKKPVTATEAEMDSNPRARSAKLRACEKV